jgi:flagellar hook-associated protein 2
VNSAGTAVLGGATANIDKLESTFSNGSELTATIVANGETVNVSYGGNTYAASNYSYADGVTTFDFTDGEGNTYSYRNEEGTGATLTKTEDEDSSAVTTLSGTTESSTASVTYGGMAGSDAVAVIDGKTYTSATNKLTVSNVTYNLLATGSSTLTVTQDTEKVVENVLKFVEDYNEMLGKLNDMYNEQKYSDYDVLTESQKKGMTQEQIEKWEEKAKSGLMYHNQTVGKLISAMREAIYTPVESVDPYRTDANGKEYTYNTLMSIGIESKTDRGILRVDEDKLRKAIANDPDCVYQLFGSLDTEKDEFSKNGVAQRLGDVANDGLKEIKTYAGTSAESADGSSLGNLIEEMKKKMSDFKTMLNAFENSLYKKYDAMESAIQRLGVSLGYVTGGQ